MKKVLIRDDDINYFTSAEVIIRLYAPLLDKGFPVNFAAIPQVNACIKTTRDDVYRRIEGLEFVPIIPPRFRGINREFSLTDNKQLVNYLRKDSDKIEILQHGYTHGFIEGSKEFLTEKHSEIERRIREGKKLLAKLFGKEPKFFVPPWDCISSEAIQHIKQHFLGISVSRINPFRLPIEMWLSFVSKVLERQNFMIDKGFVIFEHPSYILNRFSPPEIVYKRVINELKKNNILILVNHHWEYFFDWNKISKQFFSCWQKIIGHLMNENVEILTFSKLYDEILNG